MKFVLPLLFIFLVNFQINCQDLSRTVIDLNGIWEFDQTTSAFPPKAFSRKIPVPGLIHLAEPKIEEYEKFFKRPDMAEVKSQHNLYNIDYTPRYSWYKKIVDVPASQKNSECVITIKKSQYFTQVYVNGLDMGTSMACYTPVEFNISAALKYGAKNEILIKVGDRTWLPSEAAGSTDKEKEHYLPGIWDDVFLSFTGKVRINRLLVLPSVAGKNVMVKTQVRNFQPPQVFYGDAMADSVLLKISITDKKSGRIMASREGRFLAKRDNISEIVMEIPISDFKVWTPDNPELYLATAKIFLKSELSDNFSRNFGMRDFVRRGKNFYLNNERIILRGSNITLQRFFEDPDCGNLVWDKNWVKKLLIDYSKDLNWNAMRICVGIVPDFWYDLADEYGLMFQNEWFYWQNHGWNEQIRKEYTDWIWTDGSHPSIIIWDGINENWDDFIGNTLIPELKKLDPTRIWDAGYMTGNSMQLDEMDEPHPYEASKGSYNYPLGDLNYKSRAIVNIEESGAVQLVNEYGWIWLWRNGMPSKLTVDIYKFYIGPNSTPAQNRELQAYWLQLETEWLRSNTSIAGVLAFCHLTNNYGYTGDWFIDNIKDLEPGLTLRWFKHAFAPSAVFINLPDERYLTKTSPHKAGSELIFNLCGVNDLSKNVTGTVTVKLIDETGKTISGQTMDAVLKPYQRTALPVKVNLPETAGGYLLLCEFKQAGDSGPAVLSRRYLRVGESDKYAFFNIKL